MLISTELRTELHHPEIELTLEITRAAGRMDGAKGYIAYPGEVFYHSFTGGTFDINITAPPVSNDYQYSFRLCPYDANNGEGGTNGECGTPANPIAGLPMGAIDTTTAICSVSDSYGCSSFNLKVDATAPRVVANSWTLKDGNQQPIANVLPTSTYHVDIEVLRRAGSIVPRRCRCRLEFLLRPNHEHRLADVQVYFWRRTNDSATYLESKWRFVFRNSRLR